MIWNFPGKEQFCRKLVFPSATGYPWSLVGTPAWCWGGKWCGRRAWPAPQSRGQSRIEATCDPGPGGCSSSAWWCKMVFTYPVEPPPSISSKDMASLPAPTSPEPPHTGKRQVACLCMQSGRHCPAGRSDCTPVCQVKPGSHDGAPHRVPPVLEEVASEMDVGSVHT